MTSTILRRSSLYIALCRLLELLKRCKTATETKFVKRRIEDWVHPDAKLALVGESAHPQIVRSYFSFLIRFFNVFF